MEENKDKLQNREGKSGEARENSRGGQGHNHNRHKHKKHRGNRNFDAKSRANEGEGLNTDAERDAKESNQTVSGQGSASGNGNYRPHDNRYKKNHERRKFDQNKAQGTEGPKKNGLEAENKASNEQITASRDMYTEMSSDIHEAESRAEMPCCGRESTSGSAGVKAEDRPDIVKHEVVGVRFKQSGKVYYFDPSGMSFEKGAHIIVDTSRGIEFGFVSMPNRLVSEKEIVLPLRKAVRPANEEDEKKYAANTEKETEAFNLCLSKIEEHRLDMKLVDVEYYFDNSKLLFYFTSEGRVDFRELVKDLASVFRTRIELRQIGIRDEAKLMGGLGVCGRPFCCASFLPDFVQVSIKMAKEQNLSLNSAKISGACGRLMCCLRYEYDTYVEESAKTPKVDSIVSTPDGEGVVIESNPLTALLKVSMNGQPNTVKVFCRDDVVFKGYAKKRNNQKNSDENEEELKKLEQN